LAFVVNCGELQVFRLFTAVYGWNFRFFWHPAGIFLVVKTWTDRGELREKRGQVTGTFSPLGRDGQESPIQVRINSRVADPSPGTHRRVR
jgi:hypothetical protein